MTKRWQSYCSVPIKSFYIELLAVEFLKTWTYAGKSRVYYDWMVRDLFQYLVNHANTHVWVPGTYELLNVVDTWKSRAQTAYDRAVKACEYESENMPVTAGLEWQKIFGDDIPTS